MAETAKDRLIQAAKNFLKEENCAAFSGLLDDHLFVAVGTKKHIMQLMKKQNGWSA